MGRYVSSAGVVIEMGDAAARAIGFKPEAKQPEQPEPKKKAPAEKDAAARKPDSK